MSFWDKLKSSFSSNTPEQDLAKQSLEQIDWSKVQDTSAKSAAGEKVPGIATIGVNNDYTSDDVQTAESAKQLTGTGTPGMYTKDEEGPSAWATMADAVGKGMAKKGSATPFQAEAPRIEAPQDIMKAKREALMSLLGRQ